MLTLSRKTDYALAAMAHIARNKPDRVRAREIAADLNLPLPLLMNVLKELTQHDLVAATRGPKGGYLLARDSEHINLVQIIEAVDGPLHLTRCCGPRDPESYQEPACELEAICLIKKSLHRVHFAVRNALMAMTLAEIVEESRVAETTNALYSSVSSRWEAESASDLPTN